jgi:hypothetical protein
MEQARAVAEYASWNKASIVFTPNPAHNIPKTLLYSCEPSSQEKEMARYLQQVEEDEARAEDQKNHPEAETIEISSDSESGSPYPGGEAYDDSFNDAFRDGYSNGAFDDDDSETRAGGGEDTVPFVIGEMVVTVGLTAISYNNRVCFVRSNLDNLRFTIELSPSFDAPSEMFTHIPTTRLLPTVPATMTALCADALTRLPFAPTR